MYWLILVFGLILLTIGATWLTNGAVSIAGKLHISEYLTGLTVMAIGTSLPELTVGITSSISGHADIAVGDIVGSNIFNVFVILGVCSLLRTISFTKNNTCRDIPISIFATLILTVMIADRHISRIEGIAMIAAYFMAVTVLYHGEKSEGYHIRESGKKTTTGNVSYCKSAMSIVLGLAISIYGAHLVLKSVTDIARGFGISESVIAITLLAGGTSLPELASSIIATRNGHGGLALGNVLGSNIANVLLTIGICATIKPLTITSVTKSDMVMLVFSAFALLVSALFVGRGRITRYEGMVYIIIYAAYIFWLLR